MLFNSFIFLIFLAVVIPLYYIIPVKSRNWLLLLSSYFFYGYWDYRFLSLIFISTLIDFVIGKAIFKETQQSRRMALLWVSIAANIGILGFFKYFGFFVDSFVTIADSFGLTLDALHLNIILPVGISFYTFQTMSYTIDIYRKKMQPTQNLLHFAVFVSFFPQLVAGPIERAKALLPQVARTPSASREQIEKGIVLIVTGLFRKVILGDAVGRIVDHIFAQPELYKSDELFFGLVLFAVQVYGDFAGYSSIARGTAKLMGFELMKNFDQPYLSRNITELWARWHISLSSWLKDYVYISLGGNRKGMFMTYFNLILTMSICGLWHGANWNYVMWGVVNGVFLAVHKLMRRGSKISHEPYKYDNMIGFIRFLGNVSFTFFLFLIGLMFFRITSWDHTMLFIDRMWNWEQGEYALRLLIITSSFFFVMLLSDIMEYYTNRHTFLLTIGNRYIVAGILSGLFFVTLVFMFLSKPLPFVYFQF